ncbi:MAG TPA: 50S ribosomal protein L18 [Selenomonadales bacterium]|nr:50S ribosomal protein L18 [Selenomonadales bacterium]
MLRKDNKNEARKKRHLRLRKKVTGTAEKPRLNVFRSLSHIYAQIIDDKSGTTLVSASTLDKEVRDAVSYGGNIPAAKAVGEAVAKRALAKGIKEVVFDRGGYIYHGRVAALAAAAREAGLEF